MIHENYDVRVLSIWTDDALLGDINSEALDDERLNCELRAAQLALLQILYRVSTSPILL